MISEIFVGDKKFINVPANVEALRLIGLDESKINILLQEYELKQKQSFILSRRMSAYSVRSDPYFLEAIRKDAAGDSEGAEVARQQGLAAVEEIKALYPLP